MTFLRRALHCLAVFGVTAAALAGDPAPLPVSFRKDIAPVLQRRCATCHNADSAKGGYRLDSFARLTKPGESDLPALTPRHADDSELYRLLVEPEARDRMPQKADALPAREIALIKRWIEEGAVNDSGAGERPLVEVVRETLLQPAPPVYPHAVPVTALAFSPDGTQLAVSGYYEVTVWNLADGALIRRIGGLPERITALAWHPKTDLLAAAGGTPGQWGTVALIDPAADFQTRLLCDLPETALAVAFSPDGKQLALGSGDRTLRLFDSAGGKPTRVLRLHADWVQSVAFSPDGTHLVSTSRDRTVRVARVDTGELETTYPHHEAPTLAAIFSRDGKTVFSAASTGLVHPWDAATGDLRKKNLEVPGHPERLALLTGALAVGCADGLVRICQPNDRQIPFTLHGHGDAITALAVDPSGKTLASGSHDGTVCIWSLACGTWIQRFTASPR